MDNNIYQILIKSKDKVFPDLSNLLRKISRSLTQMFPGMNMPDMANVSNDMLKQQAGMFASMSDDDL